MNTLKIPPIYQKAQWHNTTRVCPNPDEIGFGLTLAGISEVVRFRLDIEDAMRLSDTLRDMINTYNEPLTAPFEKDNQPRKQATGCFMTRRLPHGNSVIVPFSPSEGV